MKGEKHFFVGHLQEKQYGIDLSLGRPPIGLFLILHTKFNAKTQIKHLYSNSPACNALLLHDRPSSRLLLRTRRSTQIIFIITSQRKERLILEFNTVVDHCIIGNLLTNALTELAQHNTIFNSSSLDTHAT